ncbi:hypothetical protein JCM10212_006888 [Sporobolomyces blumeae]
MLLRLYKILLVALFVASVAAQTTTAPPDTVLSTTSATATSSSARAAPTTNSTVGASQDLFLWPPEGGLKQCQRVTFSFTKPAVPLTCGVYVTNTSTYIEQVLLPPTYTSLVSGTFSWLVDLPAGLSVNVQIFVTLNGQIQQYTLPNLVVQDGDDLSCLAINAGQNTQSIVSYASSLNESYVYAAPTASSSSAGSNGGASVSGGTIAGAVIGSLAGIALVLILVYFLLRRHRRRLAARDPTQPFHDDSKSFRSQAASQPYLAAPSTVATGGLPHQTYAQQYAINVSGRSGQDVVPYQTARPGTLAEPMAPSPPPTGEGRFLGSPSKSDFSPTAVRTEPDRGTAGLADPLSFASRSSHAHGPQ